MLAPMVELSHSAFRELVDSFGGCDRYYTEMISASGYLSPSLYDNSFLDPRPRPEITAVQFFDSKPKQIIKAAEKLVLERRASGQALGGIDLNFGCSAPFIERTGGGVYWMKDPLKAAALVASIKTQSPDLLLSAKIRLGYEESIEKLCNFCIMLEKAGLDYLVVHPRLKHEKFRRKSRWSYIAMLTEQLRIPVIGNGDICSYSDYKKAMESFKPSGIMIGREAVRQPWIFAVIKSKDSDPNYSYCADILETGLKMLDLIIKMLPEAYYLSRAKRFFYYFCDNLSFGHHIRYAIQNALSLEQIKTLWLSYFIEVPSDKTRVVSF